MKTVTWAGRDPQHKKKFVVLIPRLQCLKSKFLSVGILVVVAYKKKLSNGSVKLSHFLFCNQYVLWL